MNSLTKSADIVAIIPEFVELQNNLVGAFRQMFPQITDWEYLLDCPRSGCLWAEGEEWQFQRHGSGICFTGKKSGKVVDAHCGMSLYPRAFEAWRLCQYLESINVERISYNSEIFEIWDNDREFCDDGKLAELLTWLLKDGAIALESPKLYKQKD